MCKMVKYLGSKSVAERESSVSGGSGKSNERAKLLLLSPPLPQHPEKNFRSVSSLPVSHFQDSQKIDLLTPSFNFPNKSAIIFREKGLCFIEKKIIRKCDTLCVLRCFTRTLAQICLFPFELDLPKIRQK